jgi:hypothetical protein
MTALNVLVQKRAAYLISDGAVALVAIAAVSGPLGTSIAGMFLPGTAATVVSGLIGAGFMLSDTLLRDALVECAPPPK